MNKYDDLIKQASNLFSLAQFSLVVKYKNDILVSANGGLKVLKMLSDRFGSNIEEDPSLRNVKHLLGSIQAIASGISIESYNRELNQINDLVSTAYKYLNPTLPPVKELLKEVGGYRSVGKHLKSIKITVNNALKALNAENSSSKKTS